MKNILIISPHGDDEVLGSFVYLFKAKNKEIKLHIIYQAINELLRKRIVNRISKEFNFTYDIAFPGFDSKMDTLNANEIVSYYDKKINDFDEIIIPSRSFHKDHKIAYDSVISALRRNYHSSIKISEHPFIISQLTNEYNPNEYISFNDIKEKIKYLEMYKPYIKQEDINIVIELNEFRGRQINCNYAETFQIIRKVN